MQSVARSWNPGDWIAAWRRAIIAQSGRLIVIVSTLWWSVNSRLWLPRKQGLDIGKSIPYAINFLFALILLAPCDTLRCFVHGSTYYSLEILTRERGSAFVFTVVRQTRKCKQLREAGVCLRGLHEHTGATALAV